MITVKKNENSKKVRQKNRKISKASDDNPLKDLESNLMKTLVDFSRENNPDIDAKLKGKQVILDVSLPKDDSDKNLPENQTQMVINRSLIRSLVSEFGHELGCKAINLDENSIPDFLFQEWFQSREFQKQLLTSFLTSIGVPVSTVSSSKSSKITEKSKKFNSEIELKGNLAYVMAEEKAIKESIKEQKHRLQDETNLFNLEALKYEYVDHEVEVITDTFIRNDFDYELTRACLAMRILDSHQQNQQNIDLFQHKSGYWPKSTETKMFLDNPLDFLPERDIFGTNDTTNKGKERLSLKEITDYENAVKNSLLDLEPITNNLASSICLNRLYEKFPNISNSHLKLLYIKFNFSESNVTAWLKLHGIKDEVLPNKFLMTPTEKAKDAMSLTESCLKPSEKEISALDHDISHVRSKIDYLNETRNKVSKSNGKIACLQYYDGEIAKMNDKLDCILEQHAYAITTFRSLDNNNTDKNNTTHDNSGPSENEQNCTSYDKMFISRWSTIDLHGLAWTPAFKVFKSRLEQLRSVKEQGNYPKYFNVITGKGINSHSGNPIIRTNLINFLKQNKENYTIHKNNAGVLLIKI